MVNLQRPKSKRRNCQSNRVGSCQGSHAINYSDGHSVFRPAPIQSGRVGSGRVGSGRVGSGRVGSGHVKPKETLVAKDTEFFHSLAVSRVVCTEII
jgi:hypothetical protein